MKFFIRLLPKEYQALLVLGQRIISSFDTKEEAMEFVAVVADSLKAKLIVPIQDGEDVDGVLKSTEEKLTAIIKVAMGNLQQAFPFDKDGR